MLAYPFVIRALRPALAAISREAIESSRTLGASATRTFLAIELPLAATGLLTGAMLSFGFSLAEMSATVLLAGAGFSTMPVTLYHLLSARNFGGASAMAVVLLVATGVCFVALEAAGRRLLERRTGQAGPARGGDG
jgi:thiamine transport system permease protein